MAENYLELVFYDPPYRWLERRRSKPKIRSNSGQENENEKIFIILIVFVSLRSYTQVHERWDVKTLNDVFIPDTSKVKKIKVAKIKPIPKVPIRNTQPRMNFEKQVIQITGSISRIQLEKGTAAKSGDMDYHIEVTDGTMNDSTMVCQAVDPNDKSASTSP